MQEIDKKILDIDTVICGNISRFDDSERGLLSQNILSQLRNFVDHISLKIYAQGQDIENNYSNIVKANAYVGSRGQFKFLCKFYNLLQISASHYTLDEENSERLMLKYFEYLLRIKQFLKDNYNLDVLKNINEFPIKIDSALKEYYGKIVTKIKEDESTRINSDYNDRYYIRKIKPFFVNYEIYYEITFTIANDRASKFDRIIAFTKFDIPSNYAVKLAISNDVIEVFGKKMPIKIIDNWEVSIRPCELDRFADIFGSHQKIQSGTVEYRELMAFLNRTGLNLLDIVNFSDNYYERFKQILTQKAKATHIIEALSRSREVLKNEKPGVNIVRYVLYTLNNKILKNQCASEACVRLSDLNLQYGCIPFDQMPFNTSLIEHNPKLHHLFECINSAGREHELFARFIKNNTEIKGQLYTPRNTIENFDEVDTLMSTYNGKLYITHSNRSLDAYKDYIYIKGYEEDTHKIIVRLKDLSAKSIKNYSSSVDSWLQSSAYPIDSDEKKQALRKIFENSAVALVYGSAGTGKTTFINHISNFFNEHRKIYLANTNPAVDNLKRRVNAANCDFTTIHKFLSPRNNDTEFDLLIIDECSTVSNSDMLAVLEKASFKLLVLVGDVFQIESIRFGNWFSMARAFVPTTSVFELANPYRSHNTKLLNLWNKVRGLEDDILEHIATNGYSETLNESIFEQTEDDEIILCLNYDGLYGINNINRFLQGNNPSSQIGWGVHTYKVNDPILFNESERFAPLIHNNMKGKIVGIAVLENQIQFDIELDKAINDFEASIYDFELLDNSDNGNSIIRFIVNKLRSTDDDDDSSSDAIVPFQVAYAVSIHKAQGLEYNSIKVVITDETEEMITHNIFYTAITRAKDKLKIYWTPETEKAILSGLKTKDNGRDVALLTSKYNI